MSNIWKARAERLLPGPGEGLAPNHIAAAQANATLALVEELRTANIIAALTLYAENNGQTFPEIQERLGWQSSDLREDS